MVGGISLDRVLKIKSLQNSKILAGGDQLDRLVTSVTVGEVPDIANWLTGGELVLSTFFAVSSDPKAISSLAKNIINGPAAALAVKPARFLESLPSDVLELAEKLEFPIIEVPSDVRWTTIIADVYETMAMVNNQIAGDIGGELLRAAIDGRGLKSIVQTASRRLDAPVIIYDFLDGIIAEATPTEPFPHDIVPLLKHKDELDDRDSYINRQRPSPVKHIKVDGNDLFFANVLIGSEVVAVVATVVPDTLDEVSINFLKRAAEAAAVEIARTRAIEKAEVKVYGDFLNDLIAGRIPLEQAGSRVSKLGADFSKGYNVLYCSFEPEEKLMRFYRETSRYIRFESPGSLLIEHEGSLVILLAHTSELAKIGRSHYVREISRKILAVSEMLNAKVAIGIGRLRTNVMDILKALDEAKVALDFGRRLDEASSITEFDQVGIYRLLLPLTREAREDGRLYYADTVGLLAEYDRRHGTDLVPTLESFRRNNENVALTAEELYTHRHTVRYRLQRIAEISGCDPFVGVEREKLYMGLYVKYLLNL